MMAEGAAVTAIKLGSAFDIVPRGSLADQCGGQSWLQAG